MDGGHSGVVGHCVGGGVLPEGGGAEAALGGEHHGGAGSQGGQQTCSRAAVQLCFFLTSYLLMTHVPGLYKHAVR